MVYISHNYVIMCFCLCMYRAVITGMAGTAMAIRPFDKVTNKFKCIPLTLWHIILSYIDIAIHIITLLLAVSLQFCLLQLWCTYLKNIVCIHVTVICDWLCKNPPCSYVNFDPFSKLQILITLQLFLLMYESAY